MNQDICNRELAQRLFEIGIYPKTIERYLVHAPFNTASAAGQQDIFEHVSKRVCILYTSRSGSTYLADTLNKTNLMGDIQEYLETPALRSGLEKEGIKSLSSYLQKTVRCSASSNGVFALKATHGALFPLAVVGEIPDKISDWHWVFVHRRDLAAQAVSLYRARRTQIWHKRSESGRRTPTPRYNFKEICNCYTSIVRAQGQIEQFLGRHGIDVLRIAYEDISDDIDGVVAMIFNHVGINYPQNLAAVPPGRSLEILRNKKTEAYAKRFRLDLEEMVLQEPKQRRKHDAARETVIDRVRNLLTS